VRGHRLGRVCVSPIDVVLDDERALVVQPDLVFVSRERTGIIQERLFGSPDLVVEVLSWGTARRDRTVKLGWYRQYGVRECWLIDPIAKQVDVFDFERSAEPRIFSEEASLQSSVLAGLEIPVASLFEEL
jgi:Uma2 family endonuclease